VYHNVFVYAFISPPWFIDNITYSVCYQQKINIVLFLGRQKRW